MQTVFRKEIKYMIPVEQMRSLEKKLDIFMIRDSNGINGKYVVRSQYYDSMTDQDLRDNLDGVEEKRKIRLRIYSSDDQKAKLEYKCKSGSDGVKYSITISREEAELMENQNYEFLLNYKDTLASRLYAKMTQNIYRPKTIIQYDRTAFLYPVSDTRITFDYNIRGSVNPYGLYRREPFLVPLAGSDTGVLEIKYNNFVPSILKSVLCEVDNLPEASSKYSKARLINY